MKNYNSRSWVADLKVVLPTPEAATKEQVRSSNLQDKEDQVKKKGHLNA